MTVRCPLRLAASLGVVSAALGSALWLGLSPLTAESAHAALSPSEPIASFSPAPEPSRPEHTDPPSPGEPSPPGIPEGKPVPSPPGTDPCAKGGSGGIPSSTACSGVADNQTDNDECQVENFHSCADPISGKAQDTWQQDQQAQAERQQHFHDVQRHSSAQQGVDGLCAASSGMRDRLSPSDVIVPPSAWWAC
jgi:hypothetical protein